MNSLQAEWERQRTVMNLRPCIVDDCILVPAVGREAWNRRADLYNDTDRAHQFEAPKRGRRDAGTYGPVHRRVIRGHAPASWAGVLLVAS